MSRSVEVLIFDGNTILVWYCASVATYNADGKLEGKETKKKKKKHNYINYIEDFVPHLQWYSFNNVLYGHKLKK